MKRRRLGRDELVAGVRSGDRQTLARAITLAESTRLEHQTLASEVLTELMPDTGKATRVGITGVPGVGKSTFIEELGTRLTNAGHRVAVLAIDPTSTRTGGSILGDKTRMTRLSNDPGAFIRPSPTSGTLGGVAARTRESLLLCEAAGYDIVLVETVGVGQSETVVADMTDFFCVLMLAGAGDELQGIKRGLMELADLIAVNKADGDNTRPAERAAHDYRAAVHTLHPHGSDWTPPVLTCSAMTGTGVEDIWSAVLQHREVHIASGALEARRRRQRLRWMWDLVDDRLMQVLRTAPAVAGVLPRLEQAVREGLIPPTTAARQVIAAFTGSDTDVPVGR